MDDFFIQEEVVIKTEPQHNDKRSPLSKNELSAALDSDYPDNVEQFLLDGPYNRDLMVYLESNNDDIKKDGYNSGNNDSDEDSTKRQSNRSPKKSKSAKTTPKVKKKEPEPPRPNITYECSLCMYRTSTETDLKSHMLNHIGGPDTDTFIEESLVGDTYKCFFCNFYTCTKELFADHLKCVHGDGRAQGKPIPKGADIYSDTDSDEDSKSDASESVHFCSQCEFSTKLYEELQSHMSVHKGSTSPKTSKNSRAKRTRNKPDTTPKVDLDRFKPTYDKDGQRVYLCTYCDYRALHRFRIVRHERIHTGEKPFACPHCSFKCNQEGTLKIHIRRHTGEKPYHCGNCNFKTISRSSLNTHEKIHDKKTDVICSDCGLGFATQRALNKHQKTHYNSSPDEKTPPASKKKKTVVKKESKSPPLPPMQSTTNGNSQSYKCSLCSFKCSKFLELSEHTQTHRMGLERDAEGQLQKQKYQCSVCGFKCAKKKELRAHIKVVHGIYKKQEAKGVTIKIGGYVLNISEESC